MLLKIYSYRDIIKVCTETGGINMEEKKQEAIRGSRYRSRFAFMLLCKKCKTVYRELGTNSYEADQALELVRKNREKCPICGSWSWDKIRRIEKDEDSE
jgi:rRNA maturation endonuclease Nob1